MRFCGRLVDDRRLLPKRAGVTRALLILCLFMSLLGGCGQKGGLTRPEQTQAISAQFY